MLLRLLTIETTHITYNSFIRSDEGLTLETSALEWYGYIINYLFTYFL